MTTIAASTTTTTAFTVSSDTSGSLVLQTGATPTTALTLDGSQNATLAGPLTVPSATVTGTMTAGTVTVPTGTLHGLVLGTAQNSTSGTSIDFTGIPSWVKRITMMLNGVSTNGTSIPQIQIGSGSYLASGYSGAATGFTTSTLGSLNSSSGAILSNNWASTIVAYGAVRISNITGNIWVFEGALGRSDAAGSLLLGAAASLSGALDRVRLTTVNGTDTFDAGSINIMYEG